MSTVRLCKAWGSWRGINNSSLRVGIQRWDLGIRYMSTRRGTRDTHVYQDSRMPFNKIIREGVFAKTSGTTLKKKRIRRNRPNV